MLAGIVGISRNGILPITVKLRMAMQLLNRDTRRIRPLQNGDHLTRIEFEKRFDATPNLKLAELINRIVYVCPPVPLTQSHAFACLNWWLGYYSAYTKGILSAAHCSIRLDHDNNATTGCAADD